MQLTILALSTVLAGFASAQSFAGLPACANNCVTTLIPSNCNFDPTCICKANSFISNISCCIFQACSTADQAAALAFANSICQPVGVTNLPTAASCPSSTAGSAAGSATASGASSASSAASSASASAASVTSAAASSASSIASAASSSASSANASISSVASSMTASAASAASSATSTSSRAAGDKIVAQGMGAVGAALMGLAAML